VIWIAFASVSKTVKPLSNTRLSRVAILISKNKRLPHYSTGPLARKAPRLVAVSRLNPASRHAIVNMHRFVGVLIS
jgi:hypothetical protein